MKIFKNKFIAITTIAALMLTSAGVLVLFRQPAKAWYTTSGTWNYRQQITINHTKVPNTDQENFPVLIKITDTNNEIFTKAKADGTDIIFTASDETTKLSHEIEKFTPTEGSRELVAWVKIPTLSFETDTIIYMYYGNPAAAGPTAPETQAVWSNGYAGVYHLSDPTNPISSTGINNGTNYGATAVTGQVDGGAGFSSQYIDAGNNSSLDVTSTLTLEMWLKPASSNQNAEPIAKWTTGAGTNNSYAFNLGQDVAANKFNFGIEQSNNTVKSLHPTNTFSAGVWYHCVGVADGSFVRMYINGAEVNTSTAYDGTIKVTTKNLMIGKLRQEDSIYSYSGLMDEPRISSVARSADWIATEYANQNDPGTFFSLEGEEIGDMVAPSNPTDVDGYSTSGKVTPITTGNFYTAATPYFEWTGAGDTGNTYISGIAGYYSYFGTSCGAGGANPTLTRGVLSDTGGGLHYSADANVTVPDLTTNNGTYCLRIKTADAAGNINGTTWEAFTYGYDITNPNPPTFIAVNPAGYSSINSFDFSWPIATDVGGSGIQGYQYKRGGASGDDWSVIQAGASVDGILSYQTGENIFIVRSVDNVNHTSAEVQTTYYYSADPPGPPTSLTADPELSETNSFEFTWVAPVHARPIVDYGYVINAVPTINNLTWTGSSSTTLAADAYATLQGVNTLYLVAKDDSGAYSIDAADYASEDFNCTTVAPPIPITVSITDSSDQALARYMLTIQWAAGVGQGASFDHYSIERSLDGDSFSEIATTSSTAYIDASSLDNATTYYYQIKAVDNAGSPSAASAIVSKMPTGKFTTPPSILSGPSVSAQSTTATVTWVVDRVSTAAIRYGTSQSNLASSQLTSTIETDHILLLAGLSPATTYYYQVQSLDALRDYTLESAYSTVHSFKTLEAPSIANVTISNLTLTSADVSWETTSASNTKVYFGTSINYGTILPEADTSMTTRHSIKLEDLEHTTKYHFKIEGPDINANVLTSDDYTFDTLSLPMIANVAFTSDFSGPTPVIKATWLTSNTPTTSSVSYRPQGSGSAMQDVSQSALVESHEVALTELENNTSYEFIFSGVDQFGNKASSDLQIFKTNPDKRAPQISNIIVESSNVGSDNINEARVVISWKTDELSTSQVAYDEGISNLEYKQKTPPDTTMTQNHLVIISGLKPQTPYHFKIISQDEIGNITESDAQIMISGQVTESVLNLVTKTLTNIFGWMGKMW